MLQVGNRIESTGSALPELIITNYDLEASGIDTTDEWIVTRTGIERRPIALKETTSEMGALAIARAIEKIDGFDPDSVGLILCATVTPDTLVPSTAANIKRALKLGKAAACDINTACSGFVYALDMADCWMDKHKAGRAIVVASERISRIINWRDRNTCALFGDGAGAVVLRSDESSPGVVGVALGNYDDDDRALIVPAKYEDNPFTQGFEHFLPAHVVMDGRAVFKFATSKPLEVVDRLFEQTGASMGEMDHVVLHQANIRIIDSVAKRYGIPEDKLQVNIQDTGNTAAASVPIALDKLVQSGKTRPGDKVLLVGFGGGLSAGAALVEL
jgi:3-oxoacyl-[acyl-carrier-protein] synthase-3